MLDPISRVALKITRMQLQQSRDSSV